VLIDHGLTEAMVEQLMTGGVTTVERLGAMTPEDLEALPGIDTETVERIQAAVNSYYVLFEAAEETAAPVLPAEVAVEDEAAAEVAVEEAAVDGAAEVAREDPAPESGSRENESVTIENAESSEPVR
jgi:N utilization substance protein A